MQVDRLGEEQRYQQIAVEGLDHQIGHHQPGELGGQPPLEQGHHGHRHRHRGGAYVRDQHREAHRHRQQRRVAQPHQGEWDIGRHSDDEDLDHLATDVVEDLLVHLHPDPVDQGAVARQEAAQPSHQDLLVLEHEEHHQGHQDGVDEDGHHVDEGAEGGGHQLLAPAQDTLAHVVDDGLHQADINQLGVLFRQGAHIVLGMGEHGRGLLGQVQPLACQGRDEAEKRHGGEGDEQQQDEAGGQGAGEPGPLQSAHRPLQQVGHHQCDQQWRQQIAKQPEHGETGRQQQKQGDGIGIGETGLIPALDDF